MQYEFITVGEVIARELSNRTDPEKQSFNNAWQGFAALLSSIFVFALIATF